MVSGAPGHPAPHRDERIGHHGGNKAQADQCKNDRQHEDEVRRGPASGEQPDEHRDPCGQFEKERGTLMLSVPTMLIRMLDHPDAATRDVAAWRIASLGGATLDNEENYLIKKLFTAAGAIQIENQARI